VRGEARGVRYGASGVGCEASAVMSNRNKKRETMISLVHVVISNVCLYLNLF
jgi:hypothetical protein